MPLSQRGRLLPNRLLPFIAAAGCLKIRLEADVKVVLFVNEREKVLKTFFADGRLKSWPVKHQKQLIVLEELLQGFQPGIAYQEAEVNQIIQSRYDDFCLIRRMWVDLGFMRRAHAIYQVNPRHLWPTFREPYFEVAEQLKIAYKSRPDVLAVGCFGSLKQGKLWAHSDLDLLLVLDLPGPQAAYQRIDGVPVHIQLLTPALLRGLDQTGLPLLQALSGVQIWSDPTGLLQTTIAWAQQLVQARLPEVQLSAAMYAIGELHLAEKYWAHGDDRDAKLALAKALQNWATLQLATQGQLPARPVLTVGQLTTTATDLYDQLLDQPFEPVLEQVWQQVRLGLVEFTQPLLQLIAQAGSLSYPELEQLPALRGQGLSERLMVELCRMGAVVETKVSHPVVGWEFKFAVAEQ